MCNRTEGGAVIRDLRKGGAMTQTAVLEQEAGRGVGDLSGKYLTFRLGDEEHGIEILKVMEIIKMMYPLR